MKTRFFLMLLLLGGLFFQSCKKDNDVKPDPNPGTEEVYFKCLINEVSYMATDVEAYAADFDSHFNVYGILSDDLADVLYIALPKNTTPGTYDLGEEVYAVATIGGEAYASYWGVGGGTVTVTDFDGTHFAGSFSLQLQNAQHSSDVLEITEGKFDVNLRF